MGFNSFPAFAFFVGVTVWECIISLDVDGMGGDMMEELFIRYERCKFYESQKIVFFMSFVKKIDISYSLFYGVKPLNLTK